MIIIVAAVLPISKFVVLLSGRVTCLRQWMLFASSKTVTSNPRLRFQYDHQVFSAGMHAVSSACLTLCSPIDCSLPGPSVHGIPQARRLEGVTMPSSRGTSQHREQSHISWISHIAGRFFTHWATEEAPRRLVTLWKHSLDDSNSMLCLGALSNL